MENKHFVQKEIPDIVYSVMYFILFLFFITSTILLSMTFFFEMWYIKRKYLLQMASIRKNLSEKGLSYAEKTWYFQENVQLTDWSECLFLELPGIIWFLGTLWIIYAVLDKEEDYARKLSKFIILIPANCLA